MTTDVSRDERTRDETPLPAQPISAEVLVEKYAKGGERSAAEVRRRVARALAAGEAPESRAHWEARFVEAQERGFVPAGRIASAAGTPQVQRAPRPAFAALPNGLRIGQAVSHARFGQGVIVAAEGSGSDAKVQINFGAAGVKWLLLAVAKLDPA